jgi:hypothetical protein
MNTQENWPSMGWTDVVDRASNSIFRVYAGSSAGTGFVIGLGSDRQTGDNYAMLATAWHVLKDLSGTPDDITIVSANKQEVFSSSATEIGFYRLGDARYDMGLILVKTDDLLIKQFELLPLYPYDSILARGSKICWLGFPGIVEPELCFFHGYISGYVNDPLGYLVDGVAINGVSGGPALDERAHVIGLVSAYLPNRVDRVTTLPGMMLLMPIAAIRYWMEEYFGAKVLHFNDISN